MVTSVARLPTPAALANLIECTSERTFYFSRPFTINDLHLVDLSRIGLSAVYSGDESNAIASSRLGY